MDVMKLKWNHPEQGEQTVEVTVTKLHDGDVELEFLALTGDYATMYINKASALLLAARLVDVANEPNPKRL